MTSNTPFPHWVLLGYGIAWTLALMGFTYAFGSAVAFAVVFGLVALYSTLLLFRRPTALPFRIDLLLWTGIAIALISGLQGWTPGWSVEWTLLGLVLPLLAWRALRGQGLPSDYLLMPIHVVGGLFLADALMAWFRWVGVWVMARQIPFLPFRVTPPHFVGNSNVFAHFLMLWIPLLTLHTTQATRIRYRRLGQIVLALALWTLTWTNSRGALLAMLVELATWFFLTPSEHRQRFFAVFQPRMLWGLYAVLLGGIFAWQISLRLPAKNWQQGTERHELWQWAWEAGWQRPIVGQGPGTWPVLFLQHTSTPPQIIMPTPHNLPLEIWSSTGLLGLAWGSILLVVALSTAWKHRHTWDIWGWGALAAWAGWFAHHMVDEFIHNAAWNGLLVTLFLLMSPRKAETNRRPSRRIWVWRGLALAVMALILVESAALGFYMAGWHKAAHLSKADWYGAAQSMERAARLVPWRTDYAFATAFAYARSAFQTTRNPERFRARLEQAAHWYEQALRREPYYAVHWANYAWVLWNLDDRPAALDAMREAAQRAPKSLFLFPLAWMYAQQGYSDIAVPLYIRGLERFPWLSLSRDMDDIPAQQRAIEVWKEGGRPEAWFHWQEALYTALRDRDTKRIRAILKEHGAEIPPQIRRYAETARAALEGDPAAQHLLPLLSAPWTDIQLWLLIYLEGTQHPERYGEVRRLLIWHLMLPASTGDDWDTANRNFITLHHLAPPPRSDLLPGFPLPHSPVLDAVIAWRP